MKNKLLGESQIIRSSRSAIALGSLLLACAVGLTACGGKTSGPVTVTPVPPAVDAPAAGKEDYSMLTTDGTMWVNQKGQKVSLRGINIGNWLSMEFWMFDSTNDPLGADIPDQCSLESKLTERFGEAEKNRLIQVHHDSWFTEQDWNVIENAGFNLVRIPFIYSVIEDPDNPMTLKDDAWKYLDWAVAEAKKRGIYVILDLHGAVGGQGNEQHTGCEGQNKLWSSAEDQERTEWLWGQIAKHYKGNSTVAGYGLLNEPWGTDSATMRDFIIKLYDDVRAQDKQHIVILPAHNSDGISPYGDPLDYGMTNVAFDAHFYPGFYGNGVIGYKVHRDWLTCGENGDTGVCDWAKRARKAYTPMLVGETQPWNGLGAMGGPITRATFDTYNKLNWAATAWSYKVTTASGGLGNGTWGYVTNNGNELIVKADTWACAGWESTFANACGVSAASTIPYRGDGTKTMYLVIKTGGFNKVDVVYDDIKLTKDSDGSNLLMNGDFGNASASSWNELNIWPDAHSYDYGYDAGTFAGGDSGAALHVTSPGGSSSMIYQAVQVEGGESYTISGKYKDLGSADTWAEIYLVPDMPQEWVDVTGRAIPKVDVNSDSKQKIEDFFSFFSYSNMDYVVNRWVKDALNSPEPAKIFTNIPGKVTGFELSVSDTSVDLSWGGVEGDVTGYKVYRSLAPRSGFEEIADVVGVTQYTDDDIMPDTTFYYYVTAYNDTDEGYASDILASGDTFYTVPTKIQAEAYTAAHPGVKTETAGDEGGGFNVGSFESGYWVDYDISVPAAGTYKANFRLASLVGDVQFEVMVGDKVLTTITVPNTGGWQTYQTLSADIDLPAGRSTLRLRSVDNQWNLNWFEINNP